MADNYARNINQNYSNVIWFLDFLYINESLRILKYPKFKKKLESANFRQKLLISGDRLLRFEDFQDGGRRHLKFQVIA